MGVPIHGVCVCVCVCVCVNERERERESERETERVCGVAMMRICFLSEVFSFQNLLKDVRRGLRFRGSVFVCVCVCERERERECVCV